MNKVLKEACRFLAYCSMILGFIHVIFIADLKVVADSVRVIVLFVMSIRLQQEASYFEKLSNKS